MVTQRLSTQRLSGQVGSIIGQNRYKILRSRKGPLAIGASLVSMGFQWFSWLSPLHCILYFMNVDYLAHCDQWQNQPRRNLIKATRNKRAQRRTTSEISEFGNLWPGCRSLKVVGLTGCVKYCCARNLHVFLQRCVSTPLRYFATCTIVKRTHIQQQPQT